MRATDRRRNRGLEHETALARVERPILGRTAQAHAGGAGVLDATLAAGESVVRAPFASYAAGAGLASLGSNLHGHNEERSGTSMVSRCNAKTLSVNRMLIRGRGGWGGLSAGFGRLGRSGALRRKTAAGRGGRGSGSRSPASDHPRAAGRRGATLWGRRERSAGSPHRPASDRRSAPENVDPNAPAEVRVTLTSIVGEA
jgi:hypothetical protein